MVDTDQNIDGYAGTDIISLFDLLDNGQPVVTSDYTFTCTFKRTPADTTAILVKTSSDGIVETGVDGQIKLTLPAADTASLYGQYVYELDGTNLGVITPFSTGILVIQEQYTTAPYSYHYTTPEAIASMLRLTDKNGKRFVFSETTDPKRSEVVKLINYKEAYIDKYTNNAWREVHVVDEIQSLPTPYQGVYPRWLATPLNHRNIVSVENLYFLTGSGNENDWVQTHEEGRGKDWYFVPFSGMLNMRRPLPYIYEKDNLRISYTYGEGVAKLVIGTVTTYTYNVPADIEEACTKLVAVTFLENDWDRAIIADGVQLSPSRRDVIDRWKEEAENNLRRRMNYTLVGTL